MDIHPPRQYRVIPQEARRKEYFLKHGIELMPSQSLRVVVAPECVTKYNELKLGKSLKYIIYKLSDDYKQIVVEDASTDGNWDHFQSKLMNAKAGHRGKEGKGPRYAVYDFQYELEGGEGTRFVFLTYRRCGSAT